LVVVHGPDKWLHQTRYALKDSIRRYCEHMCRVVSGRGGSTAAGARARLLSGPRLKNLPLAGALLDAESAKSAWSASSMSGVLVQRG
jgi:hypothetical protein